MEFGVDCFGDEVEGIARLLAAGFNDGQHAFSEATAADALRAEREFSPDHCVTQRSLTGIVGRLDPFFIHERPEPVAMVIQFVAHADQARVSAGVVSQAATANAALDANTQAMERVFEALRDAGIEDRNIRTSNFSVSPQYEPFRQNNPEPRRIVGYQVSNQVTAIVEEIDELGGTLDALVRSGANQLNNISFSIADPKPLEEEARRGAVQDAIAKAQTLAEAAGVNLGQILSIQEGGGGYQPPGPIFTLAEQAFDTRSVSVAPGESTVSISVSITYAIQ